LSNLFHDDGPVATGQKVLLATVAYESPDASYTFSIQRSRQALAEAGIASGYMLLSGNCHVDDSRNKIVQEFLLSDCTDLVFLDADVSWKPETLVELCKFTVAVVGGVYPFRRDDAGSRANMPVRMIPGVIEPESGLLEVEGLPAGFLRIRRFALESMAEKAESFKSPKDRRSPVPLIFERTLEDGNRYGGDIAFCRKWRALGGKVHAAYDLRLGHTAVSVIWDSLGAGLRRQTHTTLRHIVERVREGSTDLNLYAEARRFIHNPYGALEDVLALCVIEARKADGPIIETGSGLTTILMAAAAPDQTVWCIEDDDVWARDLATMAHEAGVSNIAICTQPIKDRWYDLTDILGDLPKEFALGLNDGPSRFKGGRMGFFDAVGADIWSCKTIIVDDADDPGYAEAITTWAKAHGRKIDFVDERAALIRLQDDKEDVKCPVEKCAIAATPTAS